MESQPANVLILGGGFAGVYTAMYLERMSRGSPKSALTIGLVNRENYIVFQPLLPEVISGTINVLHATSPIRKLAKNTMLYTRAIEHVDLAARRVILAPGSWPREMAVTYDQLVLAMGLELDCSRISGLREHALGFKNLADALLVRGQLVKRLEAAEIETDDDERRRLLSFVVTGGGFSGVEVVAEMCDFLKQATRVYHRLSWRDVELHLVQGGRTDSAGDGRETRQVRSWRTRTPRRENSSEMPAAKRHRDRGEFPRHGWKPAPLSAEPHVRVDHPVGTDGADP